MNLNAEELTDNSLSNPLGKIHVLLTGQTILVILVSVNRLSTLTTSYVLPNEFLRWVDLHNMLTLPVVLVAVWYLLKRQLETSSNHAAQNKFAHLVLNLTFIIGVYVFGAGYGNHEVTNYLHLRFCTDSVNDTLCRIIIYNDDTFSHLVWFIGFILPNVALMFIQVLFPHPSPLTGRDQGLLAFNALFVGASIVANLAFEPIGLDLYVIALLAILALALVWKHGKQPLLFFYSVAYSLGLVATFIIKVTAG
ncbi:MAG: hypothetical protein P8186_21970 [Anaerolineae bacterium]